MFCYQCEQRAKGGCTVQGVCGKSGAVSTLQDLLLYELTGIAYVTKKAGIYEPEYDRFLIEGLFTTVTNVNFDEERLAQMIKEGHRLLKKARAFASDLQNAPAAAHFEPADTIAGMVEQGQKVGVLSPSDLDADNRSLRELLKYGLKGMAAYADHALILGQQDIVITEFMREALIALGDPALTVNELLPLVMKCGEVNIRTMALLDQAHTEHFGHPVPTKVALGVKKGPAILVSGHDLLDLEVLLEQTDGKGVTIYTHGEMIPAHGYPALKKHPQLYGNYGGAWQDQQKEFDRFPGAILMTTNCIQKPKDSYIDRIYTAGLVAYPGVTHISNRDFSQVIDKAMSLGGFKADAPDKDILVGFGHNAVLSVAGTVIDHVKKGKIKHFFLIGGCDGAKSGRNYYTEFAEKVPKDSVIMTLACGKYRFNKLDFGDIEGIPRLLDIGQCNDAYSAVKIALALADAFKCTVNELPLSLILSWYEQKAVVILLSLLHLGIKNIRLGPTLPEFITPNILKVLVDNYNIMPTTTADADLKAILG